MGHALVTQSPRHMYSTEKHMLVVALALCAAFCQYSCHKCGWKFDSHSADFIADQLTVLLLVISIGKKLFRELLG
jgi:hypothetical protein